MPGWEQPRDTPVPATGGDSWFDDDERRVLAAAWEVAVTVLAFVFLGLFILELAANLSPVWTRRLQLAGYVLWAVFAGDFFVRLAFARDRRRFLRSHWLVALSVLLPWFRVFRAARAVRAVRGLRVLRVVTTGNRGMNALRKIAGYGGVGYVLGLSAIVLLLSSAGLYSLESGVDRSPIDSYGSALWWATTTIVALNSGEHPVTLEGRILGVIVMTYGLAVSGYITAVMAVFLLGLRQSTGEAVSPSEKDLGSLREEIRALRNELARSTGSRPAGRDAPSARR